MGNRLTAADMADKRCPMLTASAQNGTSGNMDRSNTKALLALGLTVFIWGVTPVAVRSVSLALGPFDAVVLRLLLSAPIYAAIAAFLGGFKLPRADIPRLLLVTFCGIFIYYIFSVFGFSFAPAGVGTLIMSSQPILVGFMTWLAGAEKITMRAILGLLVSFAGSVLLVWGDDLGVSAASKGDLLFGCFLIFLASIGWAVFVVFARPLSQRHGAIKVTSLTNMLMALAVLPFINGDMVQSLLTMKGNALFGFLFLLTVGTASNFIWNFAAPKLRPTILAAGLYVMPVVAIFMGWLVLHEAVTAQILAGAAVIMAGVAISQMNVAATDLQKIWPYALLVLASLLWGGTPVAMRYMMVGASSDTAIFARMVPAGVIAVALAVIFRTRKLSRQEWLRLLLAAGCGNFAYQAFSGFGIALIPSSWTGVLFCLEPVFIALGAVVFMHERMGLWAWVGLALAMAGTLFLAVAGHDGTEATSKWGVVLIVLSSIGWAVYTLLVRPLAQTHGGLRISFLAIALTALPTLAFTSPHLLEEIGRFEAPQWLAMTYVALGSTIVALACWTVALPRVSSAQAAMFLYLQPLVAALGGMLILDESLSSWFVVGGALILLGVFINQLPIRPEAKQTAGVAP